MARMLGKWAKTYHADDGEPEVGKATAKNRERQEWMNEYLDDADDYDYDTDGTCFGLSGSDCE